MVAISAAGNTRTTSTSTTTPHGGVHVDGKLLDRAMSALLKHHADSSKSKKNKNKEGKAIATEQLSLLGDEALVQVQFSLSKVPDASRTSPKPIRVEIPHPLHKAVPANPEEADEANGAHVEEADVCIIVKEESKPWVQDMIHQFPTHLGCVKKVLGLQSLRKKHARYQQRRDLLARYDVFLVDDRILPMVGKAIGKNFFETKRQPIPLKLTRKDALPFAVQKCLRATYMHISAGTCITVRAGNTSMPMEHLTDNVKAVITNAVTKIPRKWANVASISIKTPTSVALPIYNRTPDELADIAKMAGINKNDKDAAGGDGNGDGGNKKKRTRGDQMEEASRNDAHKKRKKELAAKSPLVRALKKQQQQNEEEEEKGANEDGDAADAPPKSKSKSAKKQKRDHKKRLSTAGKGNDEDNHDHDDDDDDGPVALKTPKSNKKKKKENKEKEPLFMASKKFMGSKKGYVFRAGREGIGYYIDVKPIVDKMAMDALMRLAGTPSSRGGGGGGRKNRTPKSGGGRGRKGRR